MLVICIFVSLIRGLPWWLMVENLPANAGEVSSIPGPGKSPEGGQGNRLQYSCLENPHGQRSLEGYSPWGHKAAGYDGATEHACTHLCTRHRGEHIRGATEPGRESLGRTGLSRKTESVVQRPGGRDGPPGNRIGSSMLGGSPTAGYSPVRLLQGPQDLGEEGKEKPQGTQRLSQKWPWWRVSSPQVTQGRR